MHSALAYEPNSESNGLGLMLSLIHGNAMTSQRYSMNVLEAEVVSYMQTIPATAYQQDSVPLHVARKVQDFSRYICTASSLAVTMTRFVFHRTRVVYGRPTTDSLRLTFGYYG